MRLAVDPAAFAVAMLPSGSAARGWLAQHACFTPAGVVRGLRALRRDLEGPLGLGPGEVWELLEGLLAQVQAVPAGQYAEFLPLALRLVPAACAPTLALALALDVDALLAGGPGFEGQRLVPVLRGWPGARQGGLDLSPPS
jgi:hypothetical protein